MQEERIKYRGFTLIELLVVIAIIAILAAILFPVFSKAMEKANQSTCLSNQRQLAISILAFAQDNDEMLPTPLEWVNATGLSADPKIFNCPTSSLRGTPGQPDYGYNAKLCDTTGTTGVALARLPLGAITYPDQVAVTCDISKALASGTFQGAYALMSLSTEADKRHRGGFILSFMDGHVQYIQSLIAAVGMTFDSYGLAATASGTVNMADYTTAADAQTAMNAIGLVGNTLAPISGGTLSGGVYSAPSSIAYSGGSSANGLALLIECTGGLQITAGKCMDPAPSGNLDALHNQQNWVRLLPASNQVGFGWYSNEFLDLTGAPTTTIQTNISALYVGQLVDFPAASKYRILIKLGPATSNAVPNNAGGSYLTDGTNKLYSRDFSCIVTNLATGAQVAYTKPLALNSNTTYAFALQSPNRQTVLPNFLSEQPIPGITKIAFSL